MLAARRMKARSGFRCSAKGRTARASSGGDEVRQLRGDAHLAEAYDESTISPLIAGPWSRITTPGSGPAIPAPGNRLARQRDAAGRPGGRNEELDAVGGWRVRASVAPSVARNPARPGWLSSFTPHQDPVAVRRLNGTTAPSLT